MEKPSGEFFATLGQYVYQYIDALGKVYYTGKGNGDRCWAHVIDKEFDPEHCYIVARNLEKFEDKKDWQSFLLESYLIVTENPEANSVSGHYKECFVMASLSSMFGKFQSDKHDMFEALPDWYVTNYDSFRERLSEVKINSSTAYFKSSARNSIYIMWWWIPSSEEPIRVSFEVNLPEGDKLSATQTTLKAWLKKNGYSKPVTDGKVQKLSIFCDDIDAVVSLFNEFMA
jgi:hypothetical protein